MQLYSAVLCCTRINVVMVMLPQFIFPNAMGHPVTAVVKTFLDQVVMAPAGIGLFFTCMGMLEGKRVSQVRPCCALVNGDDDRRMKQRVLVVCCGALRK